MAELRFRPREALDLATLQFIEALGERVFGAYSRDPRAVVRGMVRAPGSRVEVGFTHAHRPVGFVVVGIAPLGRRYGPWASPATAHLDAIAVAPELQGHGFGGELLAHAERIARDAGAVGMSLMTAKANRRARALFTGSGYRAFLEVERAYTGGEPAALMLKLLDVPVVC